MRHESAAALNAAGERDCTYAVEPGRTASPLMPRTAGPSTFARLVRHGRGAECCSMRYTVPLRVTVDVDSPENVIAGAKAELQRAFHVSKEEWESGHRPAIDRQFGHALGTILTSEALCGSVRGILEGTVPGLSVTGFYVATSEVETPD